MLKHTVKEIADKTWCIDEFRLVNTFLIEGDSKAALIDTGSGVGNLKEVVDSLTQKPLIILLTHGHPDHNSGIYQFTEVPIYMDKADESLKHFARQFGNFRKHYIETRGPVRCPEITQDLLELLPDSLLEDDYTYIPLQDGEIIDLGNRKIEVINTPGHTDGSVCFLDDKTRILFSGDSMNRQMILPRQRNNENTLIVRFHETLQKLINVSNRFEYFAIGHEGCLLDKSILTDYYNLTYGLLNQTIKGNYEEVNFRKGEVAYLGQAELWYQCDQ